MKKYKKFLLLPAVLICLWLVFILLLTGTAAIPRSAVSKNIEKSADYYRRQYMFSQMTKDENSTIVHNYADIVWLNIIYSADESSPFKSAVEASFYEGEELYKSESLLAAVEQNMAPNKSYSRYWHGATVFIKPLLMLFDIHGIRVLNAVLCILSVLALSLLCIKKRLFAPLIGYVLSLIMCFAYIIPLCMEYMPAFLLMHIFAIIVICKGYRLRGAWLALMFMVFGALVCYFDFLTNEILTLFVPLMFLLWQSYKDESIKDFKTGAALALTSSIWWLAGYALTWGAKWLLCLAVLGTENFISALSDGAYRMAGTVPDMAQNQVLGAVVMNINRLLPLNFIKSEGAVWGAAVLVTVLIFCFWYLYRKNKNELALSWVLFLIALMPYARYMVLSNHSCLHPFFTFRTQMITIMALTMALVSCTDTRRLPFVNKRRGGGRSDGRIRKKARDTK